MSVHLLIPNDVIVDSRIALLYDYESKVELTSAQSDLFYKNPLPEGKRRKAGTLELEDIPHVVLTPNQLSQQAKATRESAISTFHSVVTLDNAEFDADEKALGNINRAIRFAENNSLTETTEQEWRLADNTWRITALAEIRDLKILVEQAIDAHSQDIWTQFNTWDSGDKSQPFEVK